jgi:AraC-like DNA-binding protein
LSGTIPLIRAGSLAPFTGWLRANGVAVEALLQEADLDCFDLGNPDQPIPLLFLFRFACMASRIVGPDLPARVATRSSLAEIGTIGKIALGEITPRDALKAAIPVIPFHVTHEMVSIQPVQDGVVLREIWGMRLDDETRHIAQQYVAALIQLLCDPDATHRPAFSRMAIVAHPVHGLAHLRQHFGENVVAARDKALELHIPDRVLVLVRHRGGQDLSPAKPPNLDLLPIGKDSLIPSARIVVDGLFAYGTPTLQQLAAAAGQSLRTFQRRLSEEGMTFSRLVEDVRRERAMNGLAAGQSSAGEIAALLGYKRQSSLTRAVRRWSGATPRSMLSKTDRPREVP